MNKTKISIILIATLWLCFVLASVSLIVQIARVPSGTAGPQGPQGPQGVQGATGSTGATGERGTIWHSGSGAPTSSNPADAKSGDFYIDLDTMNVYIYNGTSWAQSGSIKGPAGQDGENGEDGKNGKDGNTWLYGETAPDAEDGKDGDFYFRTVSGLKVGYIVYRKTAGEWTVLLDMTTLASIDDVAALDSVEIASADDFVSLAEIVKAGATFKGVEISLEDNLDLSETEWLAIGDKDSKKYFEGVFDGKDHTISGLNLEGDDFNVSESDPDYYVALFGAVRNATIKNLTLEGEVTGKNAAGIAGRVEGDTVFENVTNNATVTGSVKAGGIAGAVTGGTIRFVDCVNNADITYVNKKTGGAGGIIGFASNATIEIINCENNGKIEVEGTKFYIGAAVGYVLAGNCYGYVDLTNTGELVNGTTVSDGRCLIAKDGTVICGYVGTPANWTYNEKVATAEAFVDALLSGSSVTLTEDFDINVAGYNNKNPIYITANNVVIDLNGHTLSCTGNTLFMDGDRITVKDGTIARKPNTSYTYGLTLRGRNALVENITIESGINVMGSQIASQPTNTVIRKCKFILDCDWASYAVCAQKGASVVLEDSRVERTHTGSNGGIHNFHFYIQEGSSLILRRVSLYSTVDTKLYYDGNEDGVQGIAPTIEEE